MLKKSLAVLIISALLTACTFGAAGCVDKEDIVNINCTVANGSYSLDGEITLPKDGDGLPSVVIVPGSGSLDMDGTVGAQKPYKDLAYKLAKKGVACIRFNKVTFQYAQEAAAKTSFTVDDEYFYAINSCVDILRQTARIDSGKIFLVGHSLGAQMIPIALQNDSSLAGGIIMAGTTSHILDLLMEQTARQDQRLYNEYLPYYQKAVNLKEVPVGEENYYYFGVYSAYWVSYNNLDRSAASRVSCPLLIMQGKLDLQITAEHFAAYKALLKDKSNVQYKEYARLNHIFSDGSGETVQTAYRRSGEIAAEVIDDIAQFIF